MINNWTLTQDSLPDANRLVLVKGTHEGPALAIFNGDEWRVQPFWDTCYKTKTGIEAWTNIPSLFKGREEITSNVVRDIVRDEFEKFYRKYNE